MTEASDLFERLKPEIDQRRILETIGVFNTLHRYTGMPQGEAAAQYILDRLKAYGIEHEAVRYRAYASLPLEDSSLQVNGEEIECTAVAFAGACEQIRGELFYDALGEVKERSWEEEQRRLASMKGRMVLTGDSSQTAAIRAAKAGARALIVMQANDPREPIHHANVGVVWGTPQVDQEQYFPYLPMVTITCESGLRLREMIASGHAQAILTVRMDNGIRETTMPVARIPGKDSSLVLISGHWDSWYEGITDNACSDAIMLEVARVLHAHRDELGRSVMVGWWSGHSDARYAGSTYFCDSHFDELSQRLMAHVNLDLTGCMNAEQIRIRTTNMEGSAFYDPLIRKYTGREPKPFIPMIRGADQSFFGVGVPVAIMYKYEVADEKRDFHCPSGGSWWHSKYDTLDKMDVQILMRDLYINLETVLRITQDACMPVDVSAAAQRMRQWLTELSASASCDMGLQTILDELEGLQQDWERLMTCPQMKTRASDAIIKRTAGEMNRLVFSGSAPYEHDLALPAKPFPWLARRAAANARNTPPEQLLFMDNMLMRQKNRLLHALRRMRTDVQRAAEDFGAALRKG